jgi:hypothetical protein
MNQMLNNLGSAVPVVFVALLATFTTIFWMIVGWRAMRAHERIASTLDETLPR